MADTYQVPQLAKSIKAAIRPPGSKSITNRALVCAALADGNSRLHGCLDSEDTRVMIAALRKLGLSIESTDSGRSLSVKGLQGDFPNKNSCVDLHVGNSGTTIRFLTAALAACGGKYRLDGVERMRQRPVSDLLDAMCQIGAIAKCSPTGCPPIELAGDGIVGGEVQIAGNISSQFLSGLLMAAPMASGPVHIAVEGTLVSVPYVKMTLDVMESFGIQVPHNQFNDFNIAAPLSYTSCEYAVEPDASAASYFFAIAAITGSCIRVDGLSRNSTQGDIEFCDVLETMGCNVKWGEQSVTVTGGNLIGVDLDMNHISDTVQTLAVVALFAKGTTTIRNIEHIRHKETDRISALACELRKLGAKIEESADALVITPGKYAPATIDTYDDHRMAMSFAVAGLQIPGIAITDPGCCAKTYPGFFADFEELLRTSN